MGNAYSNGIFLIIFFPAPDKTPQAYCVFHQGKWLLINQALTSLTDPNGNSGKSLLKTLWVNGRLPNFVA
jgi:hypothetical protein